jgi:hypothetical protein
MRLWHLLALALGAKAHSNDRIADRVDAPTVAAALRAAADQVVPPDPCGDDCCIDLSVRIRADLLAIADELEAKGND